MVKGERVFHDAHEICSLPRLMIYVQNYIVAWRVAGQASSMGKENTTAAAESPLDFLGLPPYAQHLSTAAPVLRP